MAQDVLKKPSVEKQTSYIDLDNDDSYEKYRGNCGLIFSQELTKAGGYSKWFDAQFKGKTDNIYDDALKLTFGVTFGGLMRDKFKFPQLYTYDYDIILRIVRGEKRFIGGTLTSSEYVYNLYIKTSVENQNEIVSKFLKQYSIISNKTDASMYRDKRRSLSLGTANSQNAPNLLVDRTSSNNNNSNNKEKESDSNKEEDAKQEDSGSNDKNKAKGDIAEAEVKEESKYEHRVCNAHADATDNKIKQDGLNDIKERIGNINKTNNSNYTVSVTSGIPNFSGMKSEDETDIIVSFVKDDIFRYQATYLLKSTFEKSSNEEKKEIYNALYKWPKSAKEIFGKNIPKRNTNGLLSVLTTVSSTPVNIKS